MEMITVMIVGDEAAGFRNDDGNSRKGGVLYTLSIGYFLRLEINYNTHGIIRYIRRHKARVHTVKVVFDMNIKPFHMIHLYFILFVECIT